MKPRLEIKKRIVFLHGAWHGGWCWKDVAAQIRDEHGFSTDTITLPGHNHNENRSGIELTTYSKHIISVLKNELDPVILVGHSSAGLLIQEAAPKIREKISCCIFINAFLLPDHSCQFDLMPPEATDAMRNAAEISPDNCIPVIEDFVRNMLMSGESEDMQNYVINNMVPQPIALFKSPISTESFKITDIPRGYIYCKDDVSLPPGAYLSMLENVGMRKDEIIENEGGHESIITKPDVIVRSLIKFLESKLNPVWI
ncbi:MAG: alpha/beta fold hydrolase [Spirochaetota bacterium]|nr:alpha/beta fold hydrolase [Spirochaetota bacterium]